MILYDSLYMQYVLIIILYYLRYKLLSATDTADAQPFIVMHFMAIILHGAVFSIQVNKCAVSSSSSMKNAE
jgi:hypothetical protein